MKAAEDATNVTKKALNDKKLEYSEDENKLAEEQRKTTKHLHNLKKKASNAREETKTNQSAKQNNLARVDIDKGRNITHADESEMRALQSRTPTKKSGMWTKISFTVDAKSASS
ncbi:hypothetical protein GGI35DRAFT_492247 [Trichoderma velutinum]